MNNLQTIIENAFDTRDTFTAQTASAEIRTAVTDAVELLNSGKARVAEKINGEWQVNEWLKKAVLLYFKLHDNKLVEGAETNYYDKVPLKFTDYTAARFAEEGMRVVPPAAVRTGSFIGRNVVVMPSYVNIGAFVDEGTMVDTWVTVGSCAQIGKNVHLSGGVGIGGVLEPLQANPTIIEDNCFIGARSEYTIAKLVQ
jgi:2,3,4,5-tetrahydropyridine-2-carboxylate N-succinyltransferase